MSHALQYPHPQFDHDMTVDLMRGFFGIMKLWKLKNSQIKQLLGEPADRTFANWKSGKVATVPKDTIRRIGYIAGIYKALQILYSNPSQADDWIHKPNRAFCGQSPLERMCAGDITDLAAVRSYLDGARSPW